MHKALLAAALLAAAPAFAQNRPDTPAQGPTPSLPNLNNPQAQANQSQQPPNARTDPTVRRRAQHSDAGAQQAEPRRPPSAERAMEALIRAAEAAADVAAAVIRPFYRQRLRADDKADSSPVTVADRSAEQAMRAVLAERFPEHGIVGEEFGEDRPGARYRWVLDPLDGTRAFLTGRPLFGTLVGLLEGDVPVLGIIDQPITGERWVGVRGQPTRFSGPHGQAGCRPCARLADAELSCTSPDLFTPESFAAFRRVQASRPPHDLGRRLLRLRPARPRRHRRHRRARAETLGLGRAGPGNRGRRRAPAHLDGRTAPPRRTRRRHRRRRSRAPAAHCRPPRLSPRSPDAARRLSRPPSARRVRARAGHAQPCHHHPRHPRAPAGLPVFPLREPERPQRRRRHLRHGRQLRRLQSRTSCAATPPSASAPPGSPASAAPSPARPAAMSGNPS